jgi:hypothetical protein
MALSKSPAAPLESAAGQALEPVDAAAGRHPDAPALEDRGIASLLLAIELFNRPIDRGRTEAVLILLHHSFEMLLKATLVAAAGKPCVNERGYSHSFDQCLKFAHEDMHIITVDQRRFLSMLDNLRDSATHYYQIVSEDLLYLFAQGSVSLFRELLQTGMGTDLRDHIPQRVLPIFCRPPKNVQQLIADEFENIRSAVSGGKISREEAMAAIRPLVSFAIGGAEMPRRVAAADIEQAIGRLERGDEWHVVFPEVACLRIETQEGDLGFGVRIVRTAEGAPVRVIREHEEVPEGFVVAKEINIFDKFTMGLNQIAKKLGVTPPKTGELIRKYKIKEDDQAFREIFIGRSCIRRFSKRALELLQPHAGEADQVWEETKELRRKKPR